MSEGTQFSFFLLNFKRFDKPLARHIKKQREKYQINEMKMERSQQTTQKYKGS